MTINLSGPTRSTLGAPYCLSPQLLMGLCLYVLPRTSAHFFFFLYKNQIVHFYCLVRRQEGGVRRRRRSACSEEVEHES